ncbi:hypothetical protein COV93_03725 [Candidatus Woesearchaeota archaeon CG11_big_fil_rev_8_21_14_0_20_43_8]|nr:MAG: hypothetical protein COV93_03725 [Candidatus Woesearchaeota archaeon CG11_big_fil_rev_8_21_14_0_20_43_8]PIO05656.1 MAG: hypothetical protein COT47_03880 [Candidatus Woesearchaeota archaeon CG08_land_8_20_14_0_20_43_7]
MAEVSNKIVLALVVAAMIISIVGTVLVTSAYDDFTSVPNGSSGSNGGGKVTLKVAQPPASAQVTLEVVEADTAQ